MYYQTPLYFVFVFGRGRDRATCVHRTPGLATYTAALGWARAYGAERVRVDTQARTLYEGLGAECPTTEPQLPTPPMNIDTYQAGHWFPVPAICYPDHAFDPERLARLWSRRVPGALFRTGAHTYQAGRLVSPLPTPTERPNVHLPTPVPPPPAPWLASVELPDVPELNAPCATESEARALYAAWCVLIDHIQLWGHPCRARLWAAAPMPPSFDGLDMPGPSYMLLQTYDPSTEGVGGPATVRDIDPHV
jgi:hypothetical protein